MEKNIRHISTIEEYNDLLGTETLNPLVSIIDFSKAHPVRNQLHTFGFYAVFLKEVKCGDMRYGRQYYDYQEGTLVCLAPGQVIGIEDDGREYQPKGYALLFHPDFIQGTGLTRNMKKYSFFSYEVNEALHISEREKMLITECLHNVEAEISAAVDRHSRTLIVSNIELLLNYCLRFYDRQFATREVQNRDVLATFEQIIDDYFHSALPREKGLLTVGYCADKMHLSANYFGDLVKKETGRAPHEHIRLKLIDIAKDYIVGSSQTIAEISYALGFWYPQHFTRMFKEMTGHTPAEYRKMAWKPENRANMTKAALQEYGSYRKK